MNIKHKLAWIPALLMIGSGAHAQSGEMDQYNYPESGYSSSPAEMSPSSEQYGEPGGEERYRDAGRSRDRGPQGPIRSDAAGEAYLDCQDSVKCQQRNPSWPDQQWWSFQGPQYNAYQGKIKAE